MASPANTSYRSANSGPKRNRTLLIVLIVIAALVAVLISAELYVRHNVKQCMAQQLESELGSQVDVGLSWKPVLLQAIDKNVPYITVTSDDSSFGPAKDMHVTAKVNDIELTDKGGGTIGSSTADVDWSTAGILATIQAQPFGQLVSGVTADPTAGTLSFQVIGLAELTVRPQVMDGKVDIETVEASVLGLGLPTDLVSGIVDVLGDSLQTLPLGMSATSLTITDGGLQMSMAGGAYTMPEASPEAQATGGGCSLM
ncbi:DUF2993 domain-containing protein [Rhodococcus maanshanensis]|uniref:LmeA family phospholipid-binding protein n=1 Tax=Rhodococcus maanshanensis TaxID=183556 RepID=UPI0022B38EEC|nr:DUF2993 domain-containing protein [Rhodococcus maanshanensis]MCZ4555121.1 DUF2993 domain-containing protein [Rhodococcus maanshanensis]